MVVLEKSYDEFLFLGILGPNFKVVPNPQVHLWDSKYVLLGSAIRLLFTKPVTYTKCYLYVY